MSKVLPEAGEYAPLWSGLFRPLRFPAYKKASAWFLVFAQLWGLESTPEVKEMTRKELLTCLSREEAGGEEVVNPVSEQRRQEEKGEATT